MWHGLALVCATGYLLGSIPFGLLLTRIAGLGDIRKVGSGNIGATNVLRTGNKGLAAATLILDALKGTLAVLLAVPIYANFVASTLESPVAGLNLAPIVPVPSWALASAGLGAFLGHIFPIWLGFKGGKGVATYIGVLIGVAWKLALLFCGIWLAVAFATRYSSLSALVASVVVPVVAFALGAREIALLGGVLSALLIWKHHANISRLMAGTEPKIGAKEKA